MQRDLLDLLACPKDRAPLSFEGDSGQAGCDYRSSGTPAGRATEHVAAGHLRCASCGSTFPLIDGIAGGSRGLVLEWLLQRTPLGAVFGAYLIAAVRVAGAHRGGLRRAALGPAPDHTTSRTTET